MLYLHFACSSWVSRRYDDTIRGNLEKQKASMSYTCGDKLTAISSLSKELVHE